MCWLDVRGKFWVNLLNVIVHSRQNISFLFTNVLYARNEIKLCSANKMFYILYEKFHLCEGWTKMPQKIRPLTHQDKVICSNSHPLPKRENIKQLNLNSGLVRVLQILVSVNLFRRRIKETASIIQAAK